MNTISNAQTGTRVLAAININFTTRHGAQNIVCAQAARCLWSTVMIAVAALTIV